MTSFEDRQKTFENKFIHDEEKIFKIRSRRRKFLGLWASEKMHMSEEDGLAYALEVVRFGVGKRTVKEIAEKVWKDMDKAGLTIPLKEVEEKMVQLTEKSIKSLQKEGEI